MCFAERSSPKASHARSRGEGGGATSNMTIKSVNVDGDVTAKPQLTSPNSDAAKTNGLTPRDTDPQQQQQQQQQCCNGGGASIARIKQLSQVDNSWSWVILISTFCNYIVVSAIWYSFSVLYKEFAEHFDRSLASIGVLASVEAAALHFTGAICSGVVEKYGSRPVAIVGSFIAAVALFSGAFVNNLTALYVVYGIAGGGIGLSYVSFVVIIQLYFDKRRTIASGFSLTGFSIASFCLPPFTRWILDLYGWRGTLIIISGFYLHGVVFAALLRPPPKRHLPTKSSSRRRTASITQRFSRQMSMQRTRSRMTKCCRVLRLVFDYQTFRNAKFVLYGLGTFFMMVGNIAFFMHLVNRAQCVGIDKHLATFLPSIYGIANGVCRLLFSVVASLPKCNRIMQYGLWITAGGLIACLSGLATDFIGLAVVCASFGMCVGAFICIQYPALVDMLGVKRIARSTGLLQIFIGSAGLIATPLAGWVYDVTENYVIPYYVMGTIMMFGGAIVLIIPCFTSSSEPTCTKKPANKEKLVSRDLEIGEPDMNCSRGDNMAEDDSTQSSETATCQGRMRTLSASSHLSART